MRFNMILFVFSARKLNLNLNFEKGFGSWVHGNNTKTKWTLHEGSTQTPETGPTIDHTYANKTGKYMYFESSYPHIKGDDAILVSPVILLPSVCVNMYYHMLGKRMGKIFWLQHTKIFLNIHLNGSLRKVQYSRFLIFVSEFKECNIFNYQLSNLKTRLVKLIFVG